MALEVNSDGSLRSVAASLGTTFKNRNSGQEVRITVLDLGPQFGDPHNEGKHYEGRLIVQLSIEAYAELMYIAGWDQVPNGPVLGENEEWADVVPEDEDEDDTEGTNDEA
jgi:hypothetical protein